MKKISLLFFVLVFFSCFKDKNLKFKADLPISLREASGIEYIPSTKTIWVHNDSGNSSELIAISDNGTIIQSIDLAVKNRDWEDITSDHSGNIYIGDFGNNANDRKNLRIYKIDGKSLQSKEPRIEVIKFKFEDQKDFPPKAKKRIFDAEAFFHFNNQLYIFTKSRIKNKGGKTNLYVLPDQAGKYKAKKIGSFENTNAKEYWITGADISMNGKKMVLLSEKNLLLFSHYQKDDFFGGKVQKIEFDYNSQKEGVCFKNDSIVYITDERNISSGGNLYELVLPKN